SRRHIRRCLTFRDGNTVALPSKAGQPLTRYFPEVVGFVSTLAPSRFAGRAEPLVDGAHGGVGAAPADARLRGPLRPLERRSLPPRHDVPQVASGQGSAA